MNASITISANTEVLTFSIKSGFNGVVAKNCDKFRPIFKGF